MIEFFSHQKFENSGIRPFLAVTRSHSLQHCIVAYKWAAKNTKVLEFDENEGSSSIL